MNAKKARQLRKDAHYHPTQERSYTVVNKSRRLKNKAGEFKSGTVELNESCSRTLYNELKKEFYGND